MEILHSDIEFAQGTDPTSLVYNIKTKLTREFPNTYYTINYNSVAITQVPNVGALHVAVAYTVYRREGAGRPSSSAGANQRQPSRTNFYNPMA